MEPEGYSLLMHGITALTTSGVAVFGAYKAFQVACKIRYDLSRPRLSCIVMDSEFMDSSLPEAGDPMFLEVKDYGGRKIDLYMLPGAVIGVKGDLSGSDLVSRLRWSRKARFVRTIPTGSQITVGIREDNWDDMGVNQLLSVKLPIPDDTL